MLDYKQKSQKNQVDRKINRKKYSILHDLLALWLITHL